MFRCELLVSGSVPCPPFLVKSTWLQSMMPFLGPCKGSELEDAFFYRLVILGRKLRNLVIFGTSKKPHPNEKPSYCKPKIKLLTFDWFQHLENAMSTWHLMSLKHIIQTMQYIRHDTWFLSSILYIFYPVVTGIIPSQVIVTSHQLTKVMGT